MTYIPQQEGFFRENEIQELSLDELDSINGGLVPLALAAAIIVTGGTFSFTIGIFDGIAEKYSK